MLFLKRLAAAVRTQIGPFDQNCDFPLTWDTLATVMTQHFLSFLCLTATGFIYRVEEPIFNQFLQVKPSRWNWMETSLVMPTLT